VGNRDETEWNAPSVPNSLDFLSAGRVLFERIDLVADFERDYITVDQIIVHRRQLGDCRKPVSGESSVAAGRGERVDGIAINCSDAQ
jgi:hypothetical protein